MTATVTLSLPPPGTKITRAHLEQAHPVSGIDTVVGPQGPPGDAGSQGPPGNDGGTPVKGVDYFDGEQGPPGNDGAQGIQGPPGADSTVPGPQGAPGNDGAQGPPGADSTVPGPQGPPGNDGAQGTQGPPGADGVQGIQGIQGVAGVVSTLIVPLAIPVLAAFPWTNMPAALSFWMSTATVAKSVNRVDLTGYTQVRLRVNKQATAGAAASNLILRYKAAPFTQVVANYSDIGTSEVSVAVNVQNGYLETGWIDLVAGAKADVFLALLGSGGDGVLDPAFGYISAEFK